MLEFKVLKATVKNGGGTLVCEMGELASHDLLMLRNERMLRPRCKDREIKIKAGSFWRPNQELAKRMKGASTHEHYDDAYLLQAAGEHVILAEEMEIEDMRRRIAEATDFSLIMFDYRALTADELSAYLAAQAEAVESLARVRDKEKIAAREMLAGTVNLVDATGRTNPMAKAMLSGGANGRFRKRHRNARDIRNNAVLRTKHVADMIDYHLDLYSRLWRALSMRVVQEGRVDAEQIFEKTAGLQSDFESLLSELRGQAGLNTAERRLQYFLAEFSNIMIRPFCKNAAHVVLELTRAIEFCHEGSRIELFSILRKIRRGIRWVFALDALQMDVILPFSILLDLLRRTAKRERGNDGKYIKGKVVVSREAAPKLFEQIERNLTIVRTKIRDKCRDTDLDRRIKEDVEMYLGTAQEALAEDDWKLAKDCLRRAARCM